MQCHIALDASGKQGLAQGQCSGSRLVGYDHLAIECHVIGVPVSVGWPLSSDANKLSAFILPNKRAGEVVLPSLIGVLSKVIVNSKSFIDV